MARRLGLMVAAVLALMAFVPAAHARNFTVNSLGDAIGGPADGVCDVGAGVCTLREAMFEASMAPMPEDDTIAIGVAGTIDVATALPQVNQDKTTIVGPGADRLTIRRSGAGNFSVFHLNGTGELRLVGATVTGGAGMPTGGGISMGAGNALTLEKVTVTGNTAIGGAGGGIYSAGGQLVVDQSTISNNLASTGGGITVFDLGAGESATITRSTISGNSSTTAPTAGGIYLNDAPAAIRGSTVAGNVGPGAGAANLAAIDSSPVTIRSTILADPIGAAASCLTDGGGTITSEGFSLKEDATCGAAQPTDISADPKLAQLNGDGGPTATMALLDGSPAIDKGLASGVGSGDQRGFDRPADLADIENASGGDGADIGAYEVQRPPDDPEPVRCRGKKATIVGSQGDDPLKGTKGRDVIAALGGRDTVTGGGGNDIVCGGAGNDILQGAAGRDQLYGELGKDRLRGGGGKGDLCSGGKGKDRSVGSCEKARSA
jgi:Ca2+-binding RTX toxin-like protein